MYTKEENAFYATGQTFYTVMDSYGWVVALCWAEDEADAVIERLTTRKA